MKSSRPLPEIFVAAQAITKLLTPSIPVAVSLKKKREK
jgi:hypothetical protein